MLAAILMGKEEIFISDILQLRPRTNGTYFLSLTNWCQ